MVLLQKLEAYPPFGAVREVNIDNATAALNKAAASILSAPLTRKQVEDRINRIVASQHSAFANVEPSDFTHPDFVRLHAIDNVDLVTPDDNININNNNNNNTDSKRPAPNSATKAKRARVTSAAAPADDSAADVNGNGDTAIDHSAAATTAAASSSQVNPASAALLRDAKLVERMRRMERSWRRYLSGDEKLKEFSRLIYGAIASNKARAETGDAVVTFVLAHLGDALVDYDAARYRTKSDEHMRDVVLKGLAKNATFFKMTGANGEQLWTIGDLALLKLEDKDNQSENGTAE